MPETGSRSRKASAQSNGHAEPTAGQQDLDGGEVTEPAPHLEEIRVDGTTQLGLIDFGGKRPTSAVIRLTGGSYKLLEGQAYAKGDVVTFSGTAVVNDVGAKDSHDPKTGIVVSAEQRHSARITDLRVSGA